MHWQTQLETNTTLRIIAKVDVAHAGLLTNQHLPVLCDALKNQRKPYTGYTTNTKLKKHSRRGRGLAYGNGTDDKNAWIASEAECAN